ncbi:hypothetical protein BFP71_07830 [Roseivirga misakiensis]|uniref:ComEC/Rec2-related protein domain-containing protein n=1 Tax=Roseivirga misakiensis TaxID=1563681 RepID=A0A1E5SK31_9BACT|nr:hypothetical protein BFP71_07830 [Roseivirga misakiensis]
MGKVTLVPWWALVIAFGIYLVLSLKRTFFKQALLSSLCFLLFFSLGAWRLHLFKDSASQKLTDKELAVVKAYKAVVTSVPEEKAKSYLCRMSIYAVWNGKSWATVSIPINAYLSPEKGGEINYGDLLFVEGRPSPTTPPSNPGVFDFQRYLALRLIHHQHFINGQFTLIGHKAPSLITEKANNLRQASIVRVKKYIKNKYAQGVTLALILGVKDALQNETLEAFSATGTMHVLAVSGLHVGIIYALVLLMLKQLGLSKRKYRWFLAIVSILVLWAYAFLTGLSPSVLRAVTMFSFVAIGKALSRNSSIYNTLTASALALLLYNPYLILNVGFQLSYVAVFGIVYLQPKLFGLIETRHLILEKVWAITCVSIAAQIATAPLSILYFHQFPTYFLVSNLLIIPAAFVILIFGLSVLVLSPISVLASAVAWLLSKVILSVNFLIVGMSNWPGSKIEGIYLSTMDAVLLYVVILFTVLFFVKKKFSYIRGALCFACCFGLSQVDHFYGYAQTNEFSVLDISKASVMDFRIGFKSKMIADSAFKVDIGQQKFNLYPKRLLAGSKQKPTEDQLVLNKSKTTLGTVFRFQGKTIMHLNHQLTDRFKPRVPILVDCLILGNNAVTNLDQLKGKIDFSKLIIDRSNSWYTDRQLTRQLDQLKKEYHSVRQNGYYSERWNRNL